MAVFDYAQLPESTVERVSGTRLVSRPTPNKSIRVISELGRLYAILVARDHLRRVLFCVLRFARLSTASRIDGRACLVRNLFYVQR